MLRGLDTTIRMCEERMRSILLWSQNDPTLVTSSLGNPIIITRSSSDLKPYYLPVRKLGYVFQTTDRQIAHKLCMYIWLWVLQKNNFSLSNTPSVWLGAGADSRGAKTWAEVPRPQSPRCLTAAAAAVAAAVRLGDVMTRLTLLPSTCWQISVIIAKSARHM